MNSSCTTETNVESTTRTASTRNLKEYIARAFLKTIAGLGVCTALVGCAHASPYERAMLNSREVLNALHSVHPKAIQSILESVAERKINRVAPEYPVFIVEILEGKVLMFEGLPGMSGKLAAELVDDDNQAYGAVALNFGKASRSGWVNMKLQGQPYRSYCASMYPFVACSLMERTNIPVPNKY